MNYKPLKRIFKFSIGSILLLIVFLLLFLFVGLKMPFVQKKLGNIATSYLSKKFESKVEVESVGIYLFDKVALKGVYVEDLANDTLVNFKDLSIDIDLKKLLKQKVEVDKIVLNDATVKIDQNEDLVFNFQFIIDAFAPKEKKEKPKQKSPWEINIKKLELNNTNAHLGLNSAKQDIKVGALNVNVNKIDLNSLLFDINKIEIKNTNYVADFRNNGPKKERQPIDPNIFPLNTLPVSIQCKTLLINNTNADILTKEVDMPLEQFNPQHIIAQNINLDFRKVVVDSTQASVTTKNLSTFLGEYININALSGKLKFAENETSATDFNFNTDLSDVSLDAKLQYNNFGTFVNLKNNLGLDVSSKPLEIHPKDLYYFAPALEQYVDISQLKDPKFYSTIMANGNLGNLNINQLSLKNGNTTLNLKGSLLNVLKTDDLSFSNIKLTASTSSKEIKRFIGNAEIPFDLSSFGEVNLNTKLDGALNNLEVNQLALSTSANTQLDISGNIQNITQPDNLNYSLDINTLNTAINDLKGIVPELPEMLNSIDSIQYKGFAKGTITNFDLDGTLSTNLGSITPNLQIDFTDNYTNASYNGSINANNFNVGKLLNDSTLGTATFTATLKGNGLSLDTINTTADILVNSFTYRNYEYKDVKIDGLLDKKKFTGDLNINDENVSINFNGKVGFDNNIPDFDFEATIDTLNLHALNLMSDTLGVKLNIHSNLTGGSLNNLRGKIVLEDIILNNQKYTWQTDSITVKAQETENNLNEILIESPFLNGNITGEYKVDKVYSTLMQTLDEYFPFSNLYSQSDSTITNNLDEPLNLKAELYLSDLTDISKLFTEDLKEFDTASILLNLDNELNTVNLEVQAPKVVFSDMVFENIFVTTNTDDGYLSTLVVADSIKIANQVSIPGLELNGAFGEGSGIYSFYILDENGERSLGTKGDLTAANDIIELKPKQEFLLDGSLWNLGTNGEFKLGKNVLEFPSFNLINGDQAILMRKNEKNDIKLLFESFELGQLTNYVFDSTNVIDGTITGSLLIKSSSEPVLIDGDVFIAAIEYNKIRLGNAMLTFQNQGNVTSATIELSDQYTDVFANVELREGNKIKGKLDLNEFDIKAIEPFIDDLISDAHGGLTGTLDVAGTINKPVLNGELHLDEVSTKVNSLGSYYNITKGDLIFNNNEIKTNIVFTDELKRTATLKGAIYHQYFSKFRFDLNLNTAGFTFLNAPEAPNIPFYGVLNAELDADIKGNLAKPEIFAVFATIADTDITIASLNSKDKLSYESYVLFVDGKDYNSYQLDSIASELYNIDLSFDLTLYANINDSANIKVIIDPISGDFLELKGNGNLVVDIKEDGAFLVNGDFEVSEGQYRFSYQDLFLKWPFKIKRGSKILFAGDIMDAALDIVAFYELKASTYSLVENEFETLSASEQKAAKALTQVEVLLNLGGQLKEPAISFDIQFPEDNSTSVSSTVVRALESIKNNETELNKQVFSLLLLQSFTSTNVSSNLASAGTQVAFNSVTSFINNQLSKLTNKANGLEVEIGLASNSDITDESSTTNTNIAAAVRQSILNDKLIISIGGNVDLESGNDDGGLTNVAGDFVLEYKITKDGNLRLSVFQKSDYDVLNQDNVWKSGVGLNYQKTFGRLIKKKSKKTVEQEREDNKQQKLMEKSNKKAIKSEEEE